MRKRIKIFTLIAVGIMIFSGINAQTDSNEHQGRYVEVEEITTFFELDRENNLIYCQFDLFNIYENESSKPVFVDVNEISNVIKFNIKSNSSQYENRRSCYLKMNIQNYGSTFRLVMDRMNVEKIFYKGEFITVNDFISKII